MTILQWSSPSGSPPSPPMRWLDALSRPRCSSPSSSACWSCRCRCVADPIAQALQRGVGSFGVPSKTYSGICYWRIPVSGLPFAIYLLCPTSPACRARSWNRRASTAPATSRSSSSCCRCPSRCWRSFAIFQFLWVWNDLLVAMVFLAPRPTRSCAGPPSSTPRSAGGDRGNPHHLGLRHHSGAAGRVLRRSATSCGLAGSVKEAENTLDARPHPQPSPQVKHT